MNWLAGLFLLAHGGVHLVVWLPPYDASTSPFDPKRSWAAARLGVERQGRGIAVALAVAAAVVFAVAGIGVIVHAQWAPALAVAGALLSLVLTLGYFNRWLLFNVVINAAIIFIVVT